MNIKLEINIYGFIAVVSRSEGWYVGVIKDLHVVDQAKTLRVLEKRLKEGADLALEGLFKNPDKEIKYYPKSILIKLGMKNNV